MEDNFNKDLINFIISIKKNGKQIIKSTLFLFLILIVFIVFVYKKKYETSITFVPHSSDSSISSPKIGSLASFAGIGLPNDNSDFISPELYSYIVSSTPFLEEVSKTKITLKDKNGLVIKKEYRNYYLDDNPKSIIQTTKEFIFSLFKKDEMLVSDELDGDLKRYSKEELNLFKSLSKIMKFTYDKKEKLITISFSFDTPIPTAELVLSTTNILKNKIVNLKIVKAKEELKYIEDRFNKKQKEFREAQLRLAQFKDKNQMISTSRANLKILDLESKYELLFSICKELEKEFEMQKIKLQEAKPVFTIINPVYVPVNKTGMSKGEMLLLGFISSLLFSVVCYTSKEFFKKIIDNIKH